VYARAVGAVADAGEGKRAVEIDVHFRCARKEIRRCKLAGEAEGGAHGTDGVGT